MTSRSPGRSETAIRGWYVMPVAGVKRGTVEMSREEKEVVSGSGPGLVLGFGFQSGRFRVDQVRGRLGFGFFFVSSEQIKL